MLGTIVNSLSILIGGLIGSQVKDNISNKYNETIMKSIGLAVILIGLKDALLCKDILLLIISLTVGSFIGEFIGIENRLNNLGLWLEKRFTSNRGGIANGFVTTSLVYCVGAMAIMGSLESGISNNHTILYAKSLIDGISALVFSSTLGIGVMFSSISVLLYQGIITLSASYMKQFLTTSVINEMSAIGGLLIVGIGLNMLEIKRIRIGNMLPSIFIPLIYYIIRSAIGI